MINCQLKHGRGEYSDSGARLEEHTEILGQYHIGIEDYGPFGDFPGSVNPSQDVFTAAGENVFVGFVVGTVENEGGSGLDLIIVRIAVALHPFHHPMGKNEDEIDRS